MAELRVPGLVAHRGYLNRYPENSLCSISAALQAGARWIEFDVQMCQDGEFVALHDASLLRTAGVDVSVFDVPATALDEYSVHEAQRFGERFKPTPLPRLVSVLETIAARPGVHAMVEIKTESLERWGMRTVMTSLLRELAAYEAFCTLISYSFEALQLTRQRCALPVGWVLRDYDEAHQRRAVQLQPDWLICNVTKLPQQTAPWPGKWQWMLYDICDPEVALAWAQRGVDLIETAEIGDMLQHPVLARGN